MSWLSLVLEAMFIVYRHTILFSSLDKGSHHLKMSHQKGFMKNDCLNKQLFGLSLYLLFHLHDFSLEGCDLMSEYDAGGRSW